MLYSYVLHTHFYTFLEYFIMVLLTYGNLLYIILSSMSFVLSKIYCNLKSSSVSVVQN